MLCKAGQGGRAEITLQNQPVVSGTPREVLEPITRRRAPPPRNASARCLSRIIPLRPAVPLLLALVMETGAAESSVSSIAFEPAGASRSGVTVAARFGQRKVRTKCPCLLQSHTNVRLYGTHGVSVSPGTRVLESLGEIATHEATHVGIGPSTARCAVRMAVPYLNR